MRRRPLCLAAYLGLAAAVWFGLGQINLPDLRRLAADGGRAEGTVTTPDCGNHNTVRYTFGMERGQLAGAGQPGAGNPPCSQLRAGDRLEVWYIPADPAVNRPGNPQSRLNNELVSVGLAASVMPAVLVGLLAHTWRQRTATCNRGGTQALRDV